jgi:hypothetical protein
MYKFFYLTKEKKHAMLNKSESFAHFTVVLFVLLMLYLLSICLVGVQNDKYDPNFEFKYVYESKKEYIQSCERLFRNVDKNPNVFRPGVLASPPSLQARFECGGCMPIKKYAHVDESRLCEANSSVKITDEMMKRLRVDVKNRSLFAGGAAIVREFVNCEFDLAKMASARALVFGSRTPWAESVLDEASAGEIVTLGVQKASHESENKFKWWSLSEFLGSFSPSGAFNEEYQRAIGSFDYAVSYGTIQQAGMGRFGEALAPNGDLEMLQMMHCNLVITRDVELLVRIKFVKTNNIK